jgi:predicted negative regulator of RcsB-dependent stress response
MSAQGKKSEHVTAPGHIAATKSATATRRHELEKNTLAETLQKFKQMFSEGFSRTTWWVIGIIAAAVVLYLIWRFFARSSEAKNSELSFQLQLLMEGESPTQAPKPAEDPARMFLTFDAEKEYEAFAKANPGTVQARIARFQLARIYFTRGQRDLGATLPQERDQARQFLGKAAKLFGELEGETSDVPVLHQEALLRTAQAYECLGEYKDAEKNYDKLAKEYKDSEYGKLAAAALKRFSDPDTLRVMEELKKSFGKLPGS